MWLTKRGTACGPVEDGIFRKVFHGFHLVGVVVVSLSGTAAIQVHNLAECCLLSYPFENVIVEGVVIVDGNGGVEVAE